MPRLASRLTSLEDSGLRGYLKLLALVEAAQIVKFLCTDAKLDVFFARLGKDSSAKRIVSLLLALLMFNRIHTARHLHLPGVLANCAMVHTAEVCFFGFEFYKRFDELKSYSGLMVCDCYPMILHRKDHSKSFMHKSCSIICFAAIMIITTRDDVYCTCRRLYA